MLLVNICVLVSAIITPPSLWWLYSTHIALLCLYQILSQNWRGLTFIGFSLIALVYAGVWSDVGIAPKHKKALWVEQAQCYIIDTPLVRPAVLAIQNNVRLYIEPCLHRHYSSEVKTPIKLIVSAHHGSWLARYAYSKAIGAVSYIPDEIDLRSTDSSSFNLYFEQFTSWRYSLSLVKGDKALWDERDKWLINYLGLTHLFVVSGLHVGFVCILALLMSKFAWRMFIKFGFASTINITSRRWCDLVLATLFSVVYASWSGAGEPVIRASVMAFLFLVLRALYRYRASFDILALCAWGMLLLWPGRVLDASYWLSFGFVLLLVWGIKKTPKYGRFFFIQCLLSVFALLLTWGWQSSISSLTIIANLIMIPFVAFIWFPTTLIAAVEFSLFNHSAIYTVLDYVLVAVYGYLAWAIEAFPEIMLSSPAWLGQKALLVVLAYLAIVWLPAWRGKLMLAGVFMLLVSKMLSTPYNYKVSNDHGRIVVEQSGVYSTQRGDVFDPRTTTVIEHSSKLPNQIIKQDWSVVITSNDRNTIELLKALSVVTIILQDDEYLLVYLDHDRYSVRSSACLNLLNLLKTDGCEHAEILESVLN